MTTITAQAQGLDLAFPDAPGFKGQGWSTQETVMVVRWLFADPEAWEQAMGTAREYPGNPHTVADTLHERIVPRSELDAIADAGGDPAKVNWLEIAHELIERRGDPLPVTDEVSGEVSDREASLTSGNTISGLVLSSPLSGGLSTIAAQALDLAATVTVAPEAMKPPGLPVPDDPAAISMFTAHRIDSVLHELTHAAERMEAARTASGDLRAYHCSNLAGHLHDALNAAHHLAENIRDHYAPEAAELDAVAETVGLAKAVSDDARAATTAHLTETTLHELTHADRHAKQMIEDTPDDEWGFNADHADKHLTGALEHAGKLREHLADNYPPEGRWLAELRELSSSPGQDDGKEHARYSKGDSGTVSAQMANDETISGQAAGRAG